MVGSNSASSIYTSWLKASEHYFCLTTATTEVVEEKAAVIIKENAARALAEKEQVG
jgi:hypothetical protein